MPEFKYPTTEKIIAYNYLALELIRIKKADKAKLLSHSKLQAALDECQNAPGDLHDKAVILLQGLVRKHPFASGNRRTAFITTKDFVVSNKGKFGIKDEPSSARALQGIRENYYSHDEIKEWIKNGKIKEFKR